MALFSSIAFLAKYPCCRSSMKDKDRDWSAQRTCTCPSSFPVLPTVHDPARGRGAYRVLSPGPCTCRWVFFAPWSTCAPTPSYSIFNCYEICNRGTIIFIGKTCLCACVCVFAIYCSVQQVKPKTLPWDLCGISLKLMWFKVGARRLISSSCSATNDDTAQEEDAHMNKGFLL